MQNLLLYVKLFIRIYFHGLQKFRAHQRVRSGELTTPMPLQIQMTDGFFSPALTSVRKIADGLQLSIAVAVWDLCKRDPTCYKERVLALRKYVMTALSWHTVTKRRWHDLEALVCTAHKYLFPYTLHGSEEKRCCCQKGASSQKSDEIRLLDTAEIFMQLSSSKCLWCPQILILVMKCSD